MKGRQKWEATLKTMVLSLGILLAAISASNAAQSCNEIAGWCVKKGASKADCYEASRMAACKKTGKYTAPNGNVWPAKK